MFDVLGVDGGGEVVEKLALLVFPKALVLAKEELLHVPQAAAVAREGGKKGRDVRVGDFLLQQVRLVQKKDY